MSARASQMGIVLLAVLALGCGDDDMGAADAGVDTGPRPRDTGPRDAGPARCLMDLDCDDGMFCNGDETCRPGDLAADERGCVTGDVPECAEGCDDELGRCLRECDLRGDQDGDGAISMACGGADCDDMDPGRSPLLSETCDGVDEDCDDRVDEGETTTFYRDADGDGFGADDDTVEACALPEGYEERGGDCDDAMASVHPAAAERCDAAMVDENCDGVANEGCDCSAGEVRACSEPGACAAGTQMCIGGTFSACSITPVVETCNEVDDDCDGVTDEFACE